MSVSQAEKKLKEGLNKLGLNLSVDPLLTYLELLLKWNQTYNLTAVRDANEMVSRHFLDSLAILPWVKGGSLLDVGTGAGFPGIPLALANPQWSIVLLDSNGKKIRFLEEVKRVLSLKQVQVVQTRVETYHPASGFDTVMTRACCDLQQMIRWTRHLIKQEGIWLAMKGKTPVAELTSIQQPYSVEYYTVPGVDEARCCVIIENNND